MKAVSLIITTLLLGCASPVHQEENDLPSGVFYPDVERSLAWMLGNRYSEKEGDELKDIARKLERALYEGELPRHSWNNGLLVAGEGDWSQSYEREWENVGPNLFRSVKPADKSNTQLVTLLEITGRDTYTITITVNDVVTKEYWVRDNDS